MAQEIRIERDVGPGARGPEPTSREPETTDEARRAIEHTRGRISATLDAIEDRIDEKRGELRDRVDVLRPARDRIRSRIWPSLAVAFGVGLLLSGVIGGEEEHEEEDRGRKRTGRAQKARRLLGPDEREELRHWRAQRRERLSNRMTDRQRESFRGRSARSGLIVAPLVQAIKGGLRDRVRHMRGEC